MTTGAGPDWRFVPCTALFAVTLRPNLYQRTVVSRFTQLLTWREKDVRNPHEEKNHMGLLDTVVSKAFRDEQAGRVVVFSGDRRNRGYLVRSEAEELKIKSFLKMFYFAHFYILILGIMLSNTWSTFVIHLGGLGRPAAHMVRSMGIAFGVYCLVVGVPYLLLWRSFKKAKLSFVSAQDEVVVSNSADRQQRWMVAVAFFALGFLVLAVGLFWLVRAK